MNILIDLMKEIINFESGNFEQDISKVKSYQYEVEEVSFDILDELYTRIIRIKGDWISSDYIETDDWLEVKYSLIFHHPELSEAEKLVINKVDTCINEFFKDYKATSGHIHTGNIKTKPIDNEEGLLISFKDDSGGGSLILTNEIEEVFKKNNLPYSIVTKQKSQFDGGASGGTESVVFFILSSIGSGLTWDVIKTMLSMTLNEPFQYLKVSFIDNFKFNNLRKTIASRINENINSLALLEFYKNEEEIILEFKTKDKKITVICDMNYIIKELKVT